MGVIKFDIRFPTGHRESTVVEGERALIGSASYCDVRLPMGDAAYEHVLIEVRGDSLRAEARAEKPPATINGMPLTASPLSPDAVLGVGNIRLYVSFVPDALDGPIAATKDKKNESSPTIRIVSILLFAVAGYMLLTEEEPGLSPPPTVAPALFAETPTPCPQKVDAEALALAQEKVAHADGKRERLPFSAKEGVLAVGLYETAAACFRVAHLESRAVEADESAKSLKHAMSDDFRARRLRLSHMLKVKDYELVKRDVDVLSEFLDGKKGDYVTWLASIKKQLKAKGVK